MVTLKRFKEGDEIPDGARFLRTVVEYQRTGRYEYSGPRGIIDFLVMAEYRREVLRPVTYYVYEVST